MEIAKLRATPHMMGRDWARRSLIWNGWYGGRIYAGIAYAAAGTGLHHTDQARISQRRLTHPNSEG